MMIYSQTSGILTDNGGIQGHTFQGYSGAGMGKNRPDMQDVRNVGPIPQGMYSMAAPEEDTAHGPYAIPLIPAAGNMMFGRGGFMLHGDSIEHPGCASHGCICISPRSAREMIYSIGGLIEVVR